MADIIKDLEWRYAVKKFDSTKEVTAPKLERLKKAFNLTATSYGLQPIKMVVLKKIIYLRDSFLFRMQLVHIKNGLLVILMKI